MNKETKALIRIAYQFHGINKASLSRAEKNILNIAVAALNWSIDVDEFGQIQFVKLGINDEQT